MNFDAAFTRLMRHEGGYSDHAADPGGETMWGITREVAREHGYTGPMRDLPQATARQIARAAYWDAVRADELPAQVRFEVFDVAYNSGVGRATRILQRAVGVREDGVIGPATLAAVGRLDPGVLRARLAGHRLMLLADLKTWPVFGRGWTRRVAANLIDG